MRQTLPVCSSYGNRQSHLTNANNICHISAGDLTLLVVAHGIFYPPRRLGTVLGARHVCPFMVLYMVLSVRQNGAYVPQSW